MSVALTGNDTTILDDSRIMSDLGNGDCVALDFPNNLVEATTGKNGNTLYAFNATGKTVTATIRVIAGSADDKYLNSRMREYLNDQATFILFTGEFIKRVGDGQGNVNDIIYTLAGGVIQKVPNAKDNQAGDNEQSVSVYQIVFGNSERAIA